MATPLEEFTKKFMADFVDLVSPVGIKIAWDVYGRPYGIPFAQHVLEALAKGFDDAVDAVHRRGAGVLRWLLLADVIAVALHMVTVLKYQREIPPAGIAAQVSMHEIIVKVDVSLIALLGLAILSLATVSVEDRPSFTARVMQEERDYALAHGGQLWTPTQRDEESRRIYREMFGPAKAVHFSVVLLGFLAQPICMVMTWLADMQVYLNGVETVWLFRLPGFESLVRFMGGHEFSVWIWHLPISLGTSIWGVTYLGCVGAFVVKPIAGMLRVLGFTGFATSFEAAFLGLRAFPFIKEEETQKMRDALAVENPANPVFQGMVDSWESFQGLVDILTAFWILNPLGLEIMFLCVGIYTYYAMGNARVRLGKEKKDKIIEERREAVKTEIGVYTLGFLFARRGVGLLLFYLNRDIEFEWNAKVVASWNVLVRMEFWWSGFLYTLMAVVVIVALGCFLGKRENKWVERGIAVTFTGLCVLFVVTLFSWRLEHDCHRPYMDRLHLTGAPSEGEDQLPPEGLSASELRSCPTGSTSASDPSVRHPLPVPTVTAGPSPTAPVPAVPTVDYSRSPFWVGAGLPLCSDVRLQLATAQERLIVAEARQCACRVGDCAY